MNTIRLFGTSPNSEDEHPLFELTIHPAVPVQCVLHALNESAQLAGYCITAARKVEALEHDLNF